MTSNQTYNIDFKKLVRWLTPNRLRNSRMLAWLSLLVSPINFLYLDFLNFREAKLYELGITPQVADLERLLNDRYDFTQRRIYIGDGVTKPTKYIFQSAELKPVFIKKRSENAPVYIYTSGESANNGDDFIVYVPLVLQINLPEIISVIKAKKLAGTKFKIQRF